VYPHQGGGVFRSEYLHPSLPFLWQTSRPAFSISIIFTCLLHIFSTVGHYLIVKAWNRANGNGEQFFRGLAIPAV
jgi:hypothetical protein